MSSSIFVRSLQCQLWPKVQRPLILQRCVEIHMKTTPSFRALLLTYVFFDFIFTFGQLQVLFPSNSREAQIQNKGFEYQRNLFPINEYNRFPPDNRQSTQTYGNAEIFKQNQNRTGAKSDVVTSNSLLGPTPLNFQELGRLALDIATCDPKTQGICCIARNYCDPNATCSSDAVPQSLFEIVNAIPKCTCLPGFSGDGRTKGTGCTNIDECATGEAGCQQICTDYVPGYACSCYDGFILLPDRKSCQDINECATQFGGCEHICVNTEGSYFCECAEGFRLSSDKHSCEDINECLEFAKLKESLYSRNTDFHPSEHNFLPRDFIPGNGGPCEYTCINTPGSFFCTCPPGYKVNPIDSTRCTDRNECEEGLGDGKEACKNDGSQLCSNTVGSYSCSCSNGFRDQRIPLEDVVQIFKSRKNLQDSPSNPRKLQQWAESAKSAAAAAEIGVQLAKMYFEAAERLSGDSKQQNISLGSHIRQRKGNFFPDELFSGLRSSFGTQGRQQLSHPNEQDQSHYYTPIFHSLSTIPKPPEKIKSPPTPELYGDLICLDIDECLLFEEVGKKACPVDQQICVNTPGNYLCTCPEGFTFSAEAGNCLDVDECLLAIKQKLNQSQKNHLRRNQENKLIPGLPAVCDQKCNNTFGGYACECFDGYILMEGGACVDVDECDDPNLNKCQHECLNLPGSYSCKCRQGFKQDPEDKHLCVDINECIETEWMSGKKESNGSTISRKGPCSHSCINTEGRYYCSCPEGMVLRHDGKTCRTASTCFDDPLLCAGDFVCLFDSSEREWACRCPRGFVHENRHDYRSPPICIDINECVVGYPEPGKNPCPEPERPCCTNLAGSFTCSSKKRLGILGYRGEICDSPSIDSSRMFIQRSQ